MYSISSTLRSTVLISSFCRRESAICEPVISIPPMPRELTTAMSSVIHTVIRSLNEERRRAGLVFLFDDIACTPHGVNEFDILALVYLLAEISDIYVDNIRAALVVVVPNVILNFLAAEYNALVHHKILQ